ncbi:hypothetical protein PanWU01x14_024970, partial [Parasponia andersonii]
MLNLLLFLSSSSDSDDLVSPAFHRRFKIALINRTLWDSGISLGFSVISSNLGYCLYARGVDAMIERGQGPLGPEDDLVLAK